LLGPQCEHLFCVSCLRRHVGADFLRRRIDCPTCATEITQLQVRHIVGEEAFLQQQAVMAQEDEELARRMSQEAIDAGTEPQRKRAEQSGDNTVRGPDPKKLEEALRRSFPEAQPGGELNQPRFEKGSEAMPNDYEHEFQKLLEQERSQQHRRAAGPPEAVCVQCRKSWLADQLLCPSSCTHFFCLTCLQEYVCTKDYVRTQVGCLAPGCEAMLDTVQIKHIVGEDEYAARQAQVDEEAARELMEAFAREEAEENERGGGALQFECPLCFDKGSRDGAIELDCDHRLCETCFHNYLSSKITEAQVSDDELVCPMPGCGTKITVEQIQGSTGGTPLWDKFLQFRMNVWQPGQDDEIMVDCPTPNCGRFLVPSHYKFVKCPLCKLQFCPKCGEKKHEGVTCEQFAQWRQENANADRHFEEMMAAQNWRRCPACRAPSERSSGCNFMQCRSEKCRKRTYWCYVCGHQLKKEDHYSHFPRGPYEDECHTPQAEFVVVGPPAQVTQDPVDGAEHGVIGQLMNWFGVPARANEA